MPKLTTTKGHGTPIYMKFLKSANNRHSVILEPGEKIISSLETLAKNEDLGATMITGIGAIKNVEVGFYHLEEREYLRKEFTKGDFELLSLNGNTSLKDGNPYVHIHTCFSDESFQVFGGHLFEAETAVTAEIFLLPMDEQKYMRELDPRVGLQTICGFTS